MNEKEKYAIIIIEPSAVLGEGLKLVLGKHPKIEVVAVFSNLKSFQNNRPNESINAILFNPLLVSIYKHFNVRTLFSKQSDSMIAAILYKHVSPQTLKSFDGVVDIFTIKKYLLIT